MKCQYCDADMENGFLQCMKRIAWVKAPHKASILPKQGEVLLENNTVKDCLLVAYICKFCKKIVVDYSDKDIKQG